MNNNNTNNPEVSSIKNEFDIISYSWFNENIICCF